ncbi:hypothetical protein D9M73_118580 [compost metagenome]
MGTRLRSGRRTRHAHRSHKQCRAVPPRAQPAPAPHARCPRRRHAVALAATRQARSARPCHSARPARCRDRPLRAAPPPAAAPALPEPTVPSPDCPPQRRSPAGCRGTARACPARAAPWRRHHPSTPGPPKRTGRRVRRPRSGAQAPRRRQRTERVRHGPAPPRHAQRRSSPPAGWRRPAPAVLAIEASPLRGRSRSTVTTEAGGVSWPVHTIAVSTRI